MAIRLTAKQLIERVIKEKGLNQKQVAEILEVSPPYVHDILHDKKSGDARVFEFAEKLGINILDEFSACEVNCSPKMIEWCRKVKYVLESGTMWAAA